MKTGEVVHESTFRPMLEVPHANENKPVSEIRLNEHMLSFCYWANYIV